MDKIIQKMRDNTKDWRLEPLEVIAKRATRRSDFSRDKLFSFEMSPLSAEEGDGWLILFPDLVSCISNGKFMTRIPKSLHTRLILRTKQEDVSINALVSSFIAESLGQKRA